MNTREQGIHPGELDAQADELLDVLPEHPINELIAALPDAAVSCLGYGSRSLVFRVQGSSFHPDITVKIFLAFQGQIWKDLEIFSHAAGVTTDWEGKPLVSESFRTACSQSPNYPDQDQILVQAYEHIRGAIARPDLICAPVAVWTQPLRGFREPRVMAVGYSLPYADGVPIRIADDEELMEAADYLDRTYGIYVGDRGIENRRTYNAVVNHATGEKRFIDVGRKAPRQHNADALW